MWVRLYENGEFTDSFVRMNYKKINWVVLFNSCDLPDHFILRNGKYIDWTHIDCSKLSRKLYESNIMYIMIKKNEFVCHR